MAAHIDYLADSSFRMILKQTQWFLLLNLFFFWDKYLAIAPKKFHHFISKNEAIGTVSSYFGWL